MKGSDENIDKLFQDRLSEGKFEVPASFTNDLNNRLDAKYGSSKKRFWIWSGMIVFVVATVVAIPWMMQPEEVDLYFAENAREKSVHSGDENEEIFNDQFNGENPGDAGNNDSSVKSTVKNTEQSFSKANSVGKNQPPSPSANNESMAYSSAINTNEAKFGKIKGTDKNSEKETLTNLGAILESSPEMTSTDDQIDENENDPIETSVETVSKSVDLLIDADTVEALGDNQMTVENFIFIDTVKVYKDSVIIRDSVVVRDSVVIRDSLVLKDSIVDQKETGNWDIALFGGVNRGSAKQMETLVDNYQIVLTPAFGFDVNYRFGSSRKCELLISSGLSYRSVKEEYDYNWTTSSTEDSIYVSGYNMIAEYDSVSGNWDTTYIAIYDTTTYTLISDTGIHEINHYSWINIPLYLQYKFTVKSWAFAPGIGVNFSFLNSIQNSTVPEVDHYMQQKIRINYQVSLQIRRYIGKADNYLFLRPYYLGELRKGNIRYQNLGVNLGVGFKL